MNRYSAPKLTEIGMLDLIEELRKQVTDLQAANTRLLEERRAVDMYYNVEHFHRVMGVPVLDRPQVPSDERVRLRLRLIAEEFFELLSAALKLEDDEDFIHVNRFHGGWTAVETAIDKLGIDVDLVEFADACADLDYVVEGSRLEFGIDGRPIARVVHESNMAKVGSEVRADGKILKPASWQPPDILTELRNQGYRG